MADLVTKFRGDLNIVEETIRDKNIALSAGISFTKLEKIPIAADGTIPFTSNLSMGGYKITDLGSPIAPSDAVTKAFVEAMFQGNEQPADHMFHYLKQTPGAPSGTATDYEICLHMLENTYYIYSGGVWGSPQTLNNGDRFVFGLNGSDITGNSGEHNYDNKVYEYNGTFLESHLPIGGTLVLIRYSSYNCDSDSGWVYDDKASHWIQISSSGGSSTILAGDGLVKNVNVLNVLVDANFFHFNSQNKITINDDSIGSSKLKFGTNADEINSDTIPEGSINKYFTNEAVDDRVNDLLKGGDGVSLNYDDTANELDVSVDEIDGGTWP